MNTEAQPRPGSTGTEAYAPSMFDMEETKRKLHMGDLLNHLKDVLDPETLHVLRACAFRGRYEELYHRLQRVWDIKRYADNHYFINLLIVTGLAAGRTPSQIAEDMD